VIDPVGRTFSYKYADNGIDLLEIRQTRAGQNELLSHINYNTQHLPISSGDAAGQITTYTYNPRGQVLTRTDPKNEVTTYSYNRDGYLTSIDGPLPGDSTTFTYSPAGRVQTRTNNSGYILHFDYDALDRLIKITYPDSTFDQFTYMLLDLVLITDRAARHTSFEYNNVRQMIKHTDSLNRVRFYRWCRCGDLKSLSDPLGRTTRWYHDVQGRVKCEEFPDGSKVNYLYDNTISRLRQRIDDKLQVIQYQYNTDNSVNAVIYTNTTVPTPAVSYTYDPSYLRLGSITDGTGTTRYAYHPITPAPGLGAGKLASIEGPQADYTITYGYDELGRATVRQIDSVISSLVFDAGSRIIGETNALGTFG
jgi:YD repeat-containing protein